MENYFLNPRKYNKLLYKYLAFSGDVDFNAFNPEDEISGCEILRWVEHKIIQNPADGKRMRVITSMRDDECEIFIQEWYDVSKPDGYINIVHHKEKSEVKKGTVSKEVYKNEILNVQHKALYNACVDYLIKTS